MSHKSHRSTFVVVTGNPEQGHGQRLSQIRSHTAKTQHLRRATKNNKRKLRYGMEQYDLQELEASSECIPQEIHVKIDPPPLPSSPTGYNRMQNFMHQYVIYSHHVHPFFSTVIHAAASHPVLMSSKILNASAWDDLNTQGKISDITLQQRNITRALLSQALQNGEDSFCDANIASAVALVLFDIVADDQRSLQSYEQVLQLLIKGRGGIRHLGFEGHLENSILLIEELKHTLKASEAPAPSLASNPRPWPPLDMSLFNFNTDKTASTLQRDSMPLLSALSDLSSLVMRLNEGHHCYSTKSDGGCLSSPAPLIINTPPLLDFGNGESPLYDARISVLLQAVQILKWSSGMSSHPMEDFHHILINFKNLLTVTDLVGFWGNLPGALIWCLIIGVRTSPGSIRKWFMMQTARVTCTMTMHYPDAVFRSLQIILEGLDGSEGRICGVDES